MTQVRTKAQILADFAGGQPEQLKTLDFIESIFSYVDTAVATNTARFAGMDADILFFSGAGAPVDYTDGDPAATGEGTAAIGSIYVNETNGKQYQNGGTKAQPVWKLVTSAAQEYIMADLAYTPEEMKAETKMAPTPMDQPDGPKYPWGLSVTLEDGTLKKLGKTITDFKVGNMIPANVEFLITSISMNESAGGGQSQCVCLTMAEAEFGKSAPPEKVETPEDVKAEKLFGKS